MHHVVSPARMPGRNAACWSGRPKAISVGPIWRSANHIAAIGAPAAISSSPMISRSIGRPPAAAVLDRPRQPDPAEGGHLLGELRASSR